MTEATIASVTQSIKQGVGFFVGLPKEGDDVTTFKTEGGKLIYVVTEAEKESLKWDPAKDAMLLWKSDEQVKRWLFENLALWQGCQVFGPHDGSGQEGIGRFSRIMLELIELANFDTSSLKVLTKDNRMTINAWRNFHYIESGISLKRVKNFCPNVPAILIAAGPSLNGQWKELKRIRDENPSAVFIVAGRTYKKAMEEGVRPDFVVEVETYAWDDKIWTFAPPPPPNCILAFPLTVCHGVAEQWPRERLVLVDHNTCQVLEEEFGWKVRRDSVDGGNGIMHHMTGLALWLGCNPIVFAGYDLAYPNGNEEKSHAEGTFHPWPAQILKNEMAYQEPKMVESNDGTTVPSSPPYRNFGLFTEIQVEMARKDKPSLKVYSVSKRGQKLAGIEYIDIEKIGVNECSNPSSLGSLAHFASPGVSPADSPSTAG